MYAYFRTKHVSELWKSICQGDIGAGIISNQIPLHIEKPRFNSLVHFPCPFHSALYIFPVLSQSLRPINPKHHIHDGKSIFPLVYPKQFLQKDLQINPYRYRGRRGLICKVRVLRRLGAYPLNLNLKTHSIYRQASLRSETRFKTQRVQELHDLMLARVYGLGLRFGV